MRQRAGVTSPASAAEVPTRHERAVRRFVRPHSTCGWICLVVVSQCLLYALHMRVLASLTPREERVLRMRFGIGMNTDHTLEEVGQQFSVTRERIRQIEAKALRKLKHPSRSRKLRSFLDT